jgi:hypothetical protein
MATRDTVGKGGTTEFALLVSLAGDKPARFPFDSARVLVGRGRDSDLRIEHAAFSRRQFLVERGVGSAGEPRFRITPYETLNQTFVNDRPAVEGTLMPGDLVAVGDVRIVLERRMNRASTRLPSMPSGQGGSSLRVALVAAVVMMLAFVGYLMLSGNEDTGAAELANAQTKLFIEPIGGEGHCGNGNECAGRAREAYSRGKKLLGQANADPGNLYRAAVELARAERFRKESGMPIADIADVQVLAQQARTRAEAEFHDAKFRLSRAVAAGDYKRQAAEATLLAKLVPDEAHPYRVKLDAYRRTLSKPKTKSFTDDF